jgi:hypothetical protein
VCSSLSCLKRSTASIQVCLAVQGQCESVRANMQTTPKLGLAAPSRHGLQQLQQGAHQPCVWPSISYSQSLNSAALKIHKLLPSTVFIHRDSHSHTLSAAKLAFSTTLCIPTARGEGTHVQRRLTRPSSTVPPVAPFRSCRVLRTSQQLCPLRHLSTHTHSPPISLFLFLSHTPYIVSLPPR